MNTQTRLPLLVAVLWGLTLTGGCHKTNSLGTYNKTPQQACAGKACGASCSACATDSCTSPDIQGACGLDGLCSSGTPLCSSFKADAGDPGIDGGSGSGDSSSSGRRFDGGADGGATAGAGGTVPSSVIGGAILTGGTTIPTDGTSSGSAGAGGSGAGASGSSSTRDAGTTDGPGQCELDGKRYDLGDRYSPGDGCNYCICSAQYGTPQFMCTGMICGGAGSSGTSRSSQSGGATGSGGTGGTTGSGGTGGSSGSGSSSTRCGDPVVMARFQSCMDSTTPSTCTTNGGTWYTGGAQPVCSCPTGQDGCECKSQDDCLGFCAQAPQGANCPNTAKFTCTTVGANRGCWCRIGQSFITCVN